MKDEDGYILLCQSVEERTSFQVLTHFSMLFLKDLKSLCEKLNIPPILSYGTCTDTGRFADLLATISNALGVPIPDLPVAAVAPEYMEQKATIDAVFALALGLYTYVNPVPTVTGAPNLIKLLTQECKHSTGGLLNAEKDPIKAVDAIPAHIEEKRKKWHLNQC